MLTLNPFVNMPKFVQLVMSTKKPDHCHLTRLEVDPKYEYDLLIVSTNFGE